MNHRGKQIDSSSGSGDNRRTYECNICKRGFTNPQALGGHSNIHRKERESYFSSSSRARSFPFSLPLPSQSPSSAIDIRNPNYNNKPPPYFPTNPSNKGENYAQGEFRGLNLSLGLGSMNADDDTHQTPPEIRGSQPQDDDLDLNLRLGGYNHH